MRYSDSEIDLKNKLLLPMGTPTKIHTYRQDETRHEHHSDQNYGASNISRLLIKWRTRELEHDSEHLQKEAGRGNMAPIWKYLEAFRGEQCMARTMYLLNPMEQRREHR